MIEKYFAKKIGVDRIFTDSNIKNWDNEDVCKLIVNKAKEMNSNKDNLKEKAIKFDINNEKKIWMQLNENNMQSFDEIKSWFQQIRDFFRG